MISGSSSTSSMRSPPMCRNRRSADSRVRDGEGRGERGQRHDGDREHPAPALRHARPALPRDLREHAGHEVGRVGNRELPPERVQGALELVHDSTSCAQAGERTGGPRLDGAAANVQDDGGLLLGELEEVAAGEDVAVALVEPVDRRQELVAPLSPDRGPLRRRGRVSRRMGRGRAHAESDTPGARATTVVRLVGHDAQEPGLEGRAGPEARQRGPGLHEPDLGRVLRVGGGPDEQVGGAEGDGLVHAHELLEGALVSPPGAVRERSVVGRPALHRPVLHLLGGGGSRADEGDQLLAGVSLRCRRTPKSSAARSASPPRIAASGSVGNELGSDAPPGPGSIRTGP